MENTEEIIEKLVEWLKDRVKDAGAKGLVFGLSGGIDSAVLAGLSKRAFPETSLGLIMPCHSMNDDEKDALLVAESLGLDTEKIILDDTFDTLMGAIPLDRDNKLAESNIKPRLRTITLYYYAQSLGYLVVGATNKSEFMTGYFTKYGDSGMDILPLTKFVKREIYELAEVLEIPRKIVDKTPSAGLWENQSDEEEMGFSYDKLEKYLNGDSIDEETFKRIDDMCKSSRHKRSFPPMFE